MTRFGEAKFVGRHDEIAGLMEALDRTTATGAQAIGVVGEAGIGKTRLVLEALQRTGTEDEATVRCSARPLGPLVDLIPFLRVVLGANAAVAVVQEFNDSGWYLDQPSGSEIQARQRRLSVSLAVRVVESLIEQPRTVVLEDLHWASSVLRDWFELLIDELLASPSTTPTTLLLITRPLPPAESQDSLLELIKRTGHGAVLELKRLSPEAEADLVRGQVAGVSRPYIDLVRRSSFGNPLRVLTAIDVLHRRNIPEALRADDVRMSSPVDLAIDLGDPVSAWLTNLPDLLTTGLGKLAALPPEFDLNEAEAVLGDPSMAPDVIEGGLEHQVLARSGAEFWFDHPQYREVLYSGLSERDRRQAHRACAEYLLRMSSTSSADVVALGAHLLLTDDDVGASARLDALRAAGEQCLATTSWTEAADLLEAALRSTPPDFPTDQLGRLHLAAGHAHYFNHDVKSAAIRYRAAASSASGAQDEECWAGAAIGLTRITNTTESATYQELADTTEIERYLAEAKKPRLRALALQILAELKVGSGDAAGGVELAEEALSLLGSDGRPSDLAWCHFALSYAEMTRLNMRESIAAGRHALDLSIAADDWFARMVTASRTSIASYGAGELDMANDLAGEAIEYARSSHDSSGEALGYIVQSGLAELCGDHVAARRCGEQAEISTRQCGHVSAAFHVVPLRTYRYLLDEDFEGASRFLSEWPDLPIGIVRPYHELLDRERRTTSAPAISDRPPKARNTWLGAGLLVAETELATSRLDRRWLTAAVPHLTNLVTSGLAFTLSYPASVHRLLGDALAASGRDSDATGIYDLAIGLCRRANAYAELAKTLLARARVEARQEGGSVDHTRRLASEAAELAEEIELPAVATAAQALSSGGVDAPALVSQRRGTWRAVMITDVVSSTMVSRVFGDLIYYDLINEHHKIVQEVVDEFGGDVFGDRGDGLFASFTDTASAVSAAHRVQDRVTLRQAPGPKLQVKVALAGGEPHLNGGVPFGLILNRAARLVDLASGGEIIVDEAVSAELGPEAKVRLGNPVDLRGLGRHVPTWIRDGRLGSPDNHNKTKLEEKING